MDNQFIIFAYNKQNYDRYIIASFSDYGDAKEYIRMVKNNKKYKKYFFTINVYNSIEKVVEEFFTENEL